MKNPYVVLGVNENASYQDIRKAYRKLSKEIHPDIDKGNENSSDDFVELNKAWNILKDPIKRKVWDERGVDDSVIKQSIYNDIHGMFFNLVLMEKDIHEIDIIERILNDIDKNIIEAKNKIPNLDADIEKLKKLEGKIKLKDKDDNQDNIFKQLIAARIAQIEGEKKFWIELPDNLMKIMEVVNQYECIMGNEDKKPTITFISNKKSSWTDV